MTSALPPSTTALSYKAAGVDIDAGDALVERIKPLAKKTLREGVLALQLHAGTPMWAEFKNIRLKEIP